MTEARRGTVVVGVDDSSHTWLAAEWAAHEAELRRSVLRLVHAAGPGTELGRARTGAGVAEQVLEGATGLLDAIRERLASSRPGLQIDTFLSQDAPAEAVLAAAEDADLIVVGSRGRGGFAGLLLGSVSLKVAAHADRPVVVVRGGRQQPLHEGIVVGVRDDRDEEAVRFALAEAELRRVGVRLVHAWTPLGQAGLMVPQVDRIDEERQAHAQLLNHVARPVADHPKVHVDTELTVDTPAGALVDASRQAGLVVVPRHPAEGRLGLHLGSVVHAVLHHAACPVAVVPTNRSRPQPPPRPA
ncbi:universal stress protein [Streptomyces sp. NPDC020490]|uniref:universal stress protein n=1 Tax=Streptomyces sp. NPDC020490 TaxID=3365078 RepID=UPI0037BA980A